ncbi:hypothetical protein D3C87_1279830 [compost metagenome]
MVVSSVTNKISRWVPSCMKSTFERCWPDFAAGNDFPLANGISEGIPCRMDSTFNGSRPDIAKLEFDRLDTNDAIFSMNGDVELCVVLSLSVGDRYFKADGFCRHIAGEISSVAGNQRI